MEIFITECLVRPCVCWKLFEKKNNIFDYQSITKFNRWYHEIIGHAELSCLKKKRALYNAVEII